MEMLSFWWNFHHWLHRKLSLWQLPVQSVIEILSKWQHFCFGVSAWYNMTSMNSISDIGPVLAHYGLSTEISLLESWVDSIPDILHPCPLDDGMSQLLDRSPRLHIDIGFIFGNKWKHLLKFYGLAIKGPITVIVLFNWSILDHLMVRIFSVVLWVHFYDIIPSAYPLLVVWCHFGLQDICCTRTQCNFCWICYQ